MTKQERRVFMNIVCGLVDDRDRAWNEGVEEGYVRAIEWLKRKLSPPSGFQIVRMRGICGEDVAFTDVEQEALAAFRRVKAPFEPRKGKMRA